MNIKDLTRKSKLLKKMDIINKFDDESVNSLILLLNNGFSIQDSFNIIRNDKNTYLLDLIESNLNKGISIEEALFPFLKKNIHYYLSCFIEYMPLSEAMLFASEIKKEKSNRKNDLIKNLLYPFTLLIGMVIGLILFSIYLVPAMSNLSNSFSNDNLKVDGNLIRITSISFLLFIFILIIIIGILFSDKYLITTYKKLCKIFKHSLIKDIYTENFVYIYYLCLKRGISTINSLNIISKINPNSVISFIAKELDKEFNEGREVIKVINNNYLSESFVKFFNIAIKTVHRETVIESYLEFIKHKINRKIKSYAKLSQAFVYLMIGGIVIYIYKILLFPINILQNF